MKVAVSGGFDPLHIGHLRMMQEAANFGKLVVILNSDEFLIRKKGYVFMPLKERKAIVATLECVYEVFECIDDDDTVCKSLNKIRPDIFANGGDRKADDIPETKICRELDIEMIFNVGGGKIKSSSELVKNARNN